MFNKIFFPQHALYNFILLPQKHSQNFQNFLKALQNFSLEP